MSKPPLSPAQRGSQPPARERAALALHMQNFAEAERLAADALKASRTDIAAVWILGRALLAQNRAAEAIAPLEKAARRSGDPGIEVLLGAALGEAGRRNEAIEHLRRTAARRPPVLPAFQELAGQLSKDGRVAEAIATIESALALAPDNIDLQLDLARLHLDRNGRAEARAVLFKARDKAPARPDILTLLARVLRLDGDHAAAADMYRHALGLRPDDAMTRADLAACLFEIGEREAALSQLRAAARGRPQMLPQAAYTLVHSSRGRFFFRPSALKTFLHGDGA